jgi:hypothetical protein
VGGTSYVYQVGDQELGIMRTEDKSMAESWASIGNEMKREQAEWVAMLRTLGVKLAHPDDGWVERSGRNKDSLLPCYPQFDDNPKVGELIALGWPQWQSKKPQHRIVRVTRIQRPAHFLTNVARYFFEPAP